MPTLQDDRPTTQTRRFWVPGLSQDPDRRSIQIGLIWTLLVHLALLLLAPQVFRSEFSPGRFVRPGTNARAFDIELAPETVMVPPPKAPGRFVETNPDANNNVPDRTDNFGAQNQQAAQPVPDKGSTLHMPKTEGRKDFQNDSQIVTGQLQQPPPTPSAPPVQQQAAAKPGQTHPKQQVPLPGYVESRGDNPDAFGTEVARFPEPSTGADHHVEGDRNSQNLTGPNGAEPAQTQHPQPLPRPRLAQVRPGILQERPVGVSNAGHIAVDAHFSQFGDYLQELIDIVQIQWERIIQSSAVYPKSGSHVTITFRITSQGQIAEILKVDGDAGDYGTGAALSAIRDPAPYRPWTKEMVAVLGDDQTITFGFYYW